MVAQQTFLFEGSGSNPTSPHQFKIIEIPATEASKMNSFYHSVLPKIHWSNIVRNKKYVCYGLIFANKCYAVAVWSSPISSNLNPDTILELRRYAINKYAPKNTASWGIGVMVRLIKKKFPDVEKLISYQDCSVHKGTIYRASNWKPAHKTKNTSWTHNKRQRNKEQATGDKIRWEFDLQQKKENS